MSLTASMWTGVSGLLAHGERMNVLGNNIANVNTVGFKGSRMDFEDFLNQDTYSAAGVTQVGRGVSIGAIFGDYSQGAFQTTNESTDLAIQGRGFFSVKPKGTEDTYYTRAGNFRFDADGYLVDPHGYVLQGWAIERSQNSLTSSAVTATSTTSKIKGSGVPVDIKLDGFTAEPQHTQNITLNVNLDSNPGNDKSSSTTNPYFSLFETWNGQNPLTGTQPALAQSAFAYQSTIKVYDEAGTAHTLTVYFDQVDPDSVTNEPNGRNQWEYIVTMDPAEDKRVIAGTAMNTTRAAGLLMTGTLTFDTTGQLVDQTAFTPFGQYTDTTPPWNEPTPNPGPPVTTPADLVNWQPTQMSSNGLPMMVANFSGLTDSSVVGSPTAQNFLMELDLGLRSTNATTPWTSTPNAAAIGTDASLLPGLTSSQRQPSATTSYAGSSSTQFQKQDGYTFGFLQNITVDRDGIMQGKYSNGVTLDLYQVTLVDFTSKQNLRREGGNLFSGTRDSGDPLPGPANSNGLGAISSNSLEQSNVDLAREFVEMITTQRGFQSNSKVITTTDTMLEVVVNMKR